MVTCLLDEPVTPPFVTQPPGTTPGLTALGGTSTPEAIFSWLDGRDYGDGVPVPPQLMDESCPPEVFNFVSTTSDMWPFAA
jgi:hypothetical protein